MNAETAQGKGNDPAGGDPFLEQFFARIPAKTAESFTGDQILAIKMAFGARDWGLHAIDLRFSVPLLHYYVVMVAGPEKRSKLRRRKDRGFHPVATLGNSLALILFLALLAVPIGLTAYTVKSGLDINLFEDSGVHDILSDLKRQIILFLK
jgi:hypothetical protein